MDQLELPILVLDNRRTTFNEVAGIHIGKRTHRLDFGMMDMPADDPVQSLIVEGIHDALLVIRDELDRILDLELHKGGEREVGPNPQKAPNGSEGTIAFQQEVVALAAQFGDPLMILCNGVVLIAMNDEITLSIRRFVDDGVLDLDIPEHVIVIIPDVFIVIPGNIDHLGVMSGLTKNLLDDRIVFLGPIDALRKGPEIDDISDQIEHIAFVVLQKVEKNIGLTLSRTNVQV